MKPLSILYKHVFQLMMLFLFTVSINGYSQDSVSLTTRVLDFPDKFFGSLENKSQKLEQRLFKATDRYLNKLNRQENKIKRKLAKVDSAQASEVFGDVDQRYADLKNKLQQAPGKLNLPYNPYRDSINTALKFLGNNTLIAQSKKQQQAIGAALKNYQGVQDKLGSATNIQQQLQQRQAYLKEKLSGSVIGKSYRRFTKDVYYYKEQVRVYRDMVNDPEAIGRKALSLLTKVPAFNDFMQKNSLLAQLFPMPDNYGTPAALAGLQTRVQVQQVMNDRMISIGGGGQNILAQNLQTARNELKVLKDKVNKLGGNSEDLELPDFEPNRQKTKSLFDRVELGCNMQSTRSNGYLPSGSDVALSIGYRLNDKSILGVGGAYSMGFGKDIRHLAFTSEGVGLRSFFDYKLKGSFWMTVGAEANYKSRFHTIEQLKNISAWSNSALAGISKKYQINKKVKGEMKLLYDVLWARQFPRTQPIFFRFGYSIK